MNQDQPKKNPLQKISEDFKKGLSKFQGDVNHFFQAPAAKNSVEANQETEDFEESPQQQPSKEINRTPTVLQAELQEKWDQFLAKSQSDLKSLENTWNQSVEQMREKGEERRKNRLQRRDIRRKQQKENTEKLQAFFQSQNKQVETTFQTIEKKIQDRKIKNREKAFENLDKMQNNWDKVMNKQQKVIEQNFSAVNSFGWKQSMRIILIIVPILVIFIIIFSLIKPFLI